MSQDFENTIHMSIKTYKRNISEVTCDHAFLNYSIQMGYSIDVGKLIFSFFIYVIIPLLLDWGTLHLFMLYVLKLV
ncbi:hypothetical protein IEQ34_012372 [Dendrobium chrysotoxum]|uniref:Uncharacterized protein n=1 Tax=Dendrobium chrysotoxum TaxID=161865 RepID=A0AAV7GV84_DENCH|nr:hypothetical protein IEQ34_012372 [Dendrobium chrysotoxum]